MPSLSTPGHGPKSDNRGGGWLDTGSRVSGVSKGDTVAGLEVKNTQGATINIERRCLIELMKLNLLEDAKL
eukprot:619410-Prorocentrum_minimum.AAC.5